MTAAWFRVGLGKLVCDPEVREAQLAMWRSGTIDPAKAVFDKMSFKLEFTLAGMIGIANSMGAGGMRSLFRAAAAGVTLPNGNERELEIARKAVTAYVAKDPHLKPSDRDAVQRALYQPETVDCTPLGHRAKRACMIVKYFAPAKATPFSELGTFAVR